MTKALIVYMDGEIEEFEYTGNYQKLCSIVDGNIDAVYFGEQEYFCYVNDEGKLVGLEENKLATELWYNSGQRILLGDYLAGNVVFFGGVDDEGNNLDYPEILKTQLSKIQ